MVLKQCLSNVVVFGIFSSIEKERSDRIIIHPTSLLSFKIAFRLLLNVLLIAVASAAATTFYYS